ncbi:blue-light-activated protein [Mariprofundus micogutta]|uniref:histidine kinase n=1 Tax=Mariprofundus micogutta TaxID=1921010 RepID=A0A1L8CP58_9PROT|nr:PAS domain S-box protein [Mariprofundus micogutta]GAV20706.1 blue-light-activated protein [Mariprofundus micogutta]
MSEIQNHSILTKVLTATVVGFLVLVFAFHYSLRQQQEQQFQTHMKDSYSRLTSELESSINSHSDWMDTLLEQLRISGNTEQFSRAMRSGDREQLDVLSRKYFELLNVNNHVTHMYFLNQQRRVILRLHQPERFGDRIERYTTLKAEQSGHITSGIELGPLGTLSLRVVSPWFENGDRIGYVELGIELEDILTDIVQNNPFDVILTINKRELTKRNWQLGQQMLKRKGSWEQLDQSIVFFPFSGIANLAGSIAGEMDKPALSSKMVKIDGKCFGLKQQSFLDVSGKEIGQLILLMDVSEDHQESKSVLYWTMGLFLILVIGVALLLYLIINRTEKARDRAEARLRLASEAIAKTVDGIIITDDKGIILEVNGAFEKVTGFTRKEAVGNKPSMLQSGMHSEQFYRDMWASIVEHGQWQGRVVNRRKNGEEYPEHLSITAISDDQGVVKNYVGVFSDISEQESLQRQFFRAQRMESLATLVGGIAHEFNNMLAGMTGNLYLAMHETKDMPDTTEKLKTVDKLSFQAAEMIKQLLAFAEKGITRKESFSAQELLQGVLEHANLSVPENIKFSVSQPQETLMLMADKTQSQQVVLNLIKNAVDAVASTSHPEISVTCALYIADQAFHQKHEQVSGDRFLCISVTDNGCGIAQEDQEKIFEPFYSTKEVGEGTGLGLAMVKPFWWLTMTRWLLKQRGTFSPDSVIWCCLHLTVNRAWTCINSSTQILIWY